ncbi:MAG: hypothetical protein P8Y18_08185 [Candidatus Bathyarchaeota archaeon]
MKKIKFLKTSTFRGLVYILILISYLIPLNNLLNPVYANVPSILNVEPWVNGTNTILNITVSHLGATNSHFINTVQVEIDGVVNNLNLNPQTTDTFIVQYNMGELNSEPTVRVRAHCNVHGYSNWSTAETIPEFEATNPLIIFIILSIITIVLTSKLKK